MYLPEYREGRKEYLCATDGDESEKKILLVLQIAAQVVTLDDESMRIDVFRYMFNDNKTFDEAKQAAEERLNSQLKELGEIHPPKGLKT